MHLYFYVPQREAWSYQCFHAFECPVNLCKFVCESSQYLIGLISKELQYPGWMWISLTCMLWSDDFSCECPTPSSSQGLIQLADPSFPRCVCVCVCVCVCGGGGAGGREVVKCLFLQKHIALVIFQRGGSGPTLNRPLSIWKALITQKLYSFYWNCTVSITKKSSWKHWKISRWQKIMQNYPVCKE